MLDPQQVEKMLEMAKELSSLLRPRYTLLFIAVRTGLRRGELLGLRWKDVNLKTGTLSVRQSQAYTPEKGIFFKPPKKQEKPAHNKDFRRSDRSPQET